MAKRKRKLNAAQKAEKKRRQKEYMTIFINGKQKRVKRPPTVDGMDVDEFIRRNADPIWLHQNEMWEYMTDEEESWIPNMAVHWTACYLTGDFYMNYRFFNISKC